jgi:hypothetical protein
MLLARLGNPPLPGKLGANMAAKAKLWPFLEVNVPYTFQVISSALRSAKPEANRGELSSYIRIYSVIYDSG